MVLLLQTQEEMIIQVLLKKFQARERGGRGLYISVMLSLKTIITVCEFSFMNNLFIDKIQLVN